MRIALLSSAGPRTGAAASFTKLAAGLEARGHEVCRLAPDVGAARRAIPGATAAAFEPEVVLADQASDAAWAAAAPALRDVPLVYRYNRVHGRRDAGAPERRTAERLAGCIYQSRFLHADALAHEPWLASVPAWEVPNGFDTEWFAPGPAGAFRARHHLGASVRIVLTVGALTAGKAQEVGIAALSRLRRDGLDLVYLLAGEGGHGAELRSRAASAGVPLHELGWLEAGELQEAYRAADVVLHPSDHEIFPNAVGEAMACGCAVVASSAGGTPELVGEDGRAGLLVPPGDAAAAARAVGLLLADFARRAAVGLAARTRILGEFPLSRMVEGTERALRAAAVGGRDAPGPGGLLD